MVLKSRTTRPETTLPAPCVTRHSPAHQGPRNTRAKDLENPRQEEPPKAPITQTKQAGKHFCDPKDARLVLPLTHNRDDAHPGALGTVVLPVKSS